MSLKSPKVLLVMGFLAGFGAAVFVWQQFVTARLTAENQQLREAVKQVSVLTEANARLASERIDPTELKRLREGQAELLRLRGQISLLRRELQEAKAAAVAGAKKAPPSVPELPEPSELPVDSFTANVTASVGWNQTLVTGGWRMPSGKRAFVLLQPTATVDANGVLVRSHLIAVPENVLAGLGLDGLQAEASANNRSGMLSAEQTSGLLKILEKTDGVEMLASPAVVTLSGRQAQVRVAETHTLPSGQTYTTGPVIDLVPTIAPDQQTVELKVTAQVNLPRTPPEP